MGKKPKKRTDSGRWWRAARPAVAVVLTLAVVGGVLLALRSLGDEALRGIGPRDRYRVRFADVRCDPPPGTDRPTFLTEVRYAADFPETFNALDPADRDRLAAAFAGHPRVEAVTGVTVEPQTVVRVTLTFRTPVLAVTLADGSTRVVDGHGVLLPETAASPGLPVLATRVPPPTTPAGKVWPDDTIQRAVELVKAYAPVRLERIWVGWRLTQPDGQMLVVGR